MSQSELKTVVITGVTGFLGSSITRRLLDENYNVIGLKRTTSKIWRIENIKNDPRLSLYDIDKSDPEEIFNNNKIEAIIHTATEYGREKSPLYKILEANLILPIRLAELGIHAGTKLFINTDSYFNKNNNSYSHLLNYSLSKKSLLIWLNKISKKIKIINAVLEHIYGPGDAPSKFVEGIIRKIAVEKVEHISLTHGHQKRDFIYIDDVVEAYSRILKFGLTHEFSMKTFEIGTGESTEINNLVKQIKILSKSPTILGFGELPYRSDEIMESVADNAELREQGWRPSITLKDGINIILQTYNSKAQ